MGGDSQPSRLRGTYWLPVLLAASFPLIALTWLAAHRPGGSAEPPPADGPLLPSLFTPEVQFWAADILHWAAEYQLPAELVATVMQIESCGHPQVQSRAGALGLFQVMPYHFAAGEAALDPEVNARRGLRYLVRSHELAGGDRRLTLAGYNGGHGVIGRPTAHWPDETRRYVGWGARILEDVDQGLAFSPGLQDWLEAGGASLCNKAADYLGSG